RISTFLVWQAAYAEHHFADVLWREFGPAELAAALLESSGRRRSLGLVSEDDFDAGLTAGRARPPSLAVASNAVHRSVRMLKQRLIVAAVGLPLLALLLVVPERIFSAVVTAVLAAAAYEMVRAGLPDTSRQTAITAAVVTALIAATARGVP